ncbi:hypothetical protein V6N13_007786 [Hibiscus sabdariffa]|uniref:Uncharacterized protein n=1 Tax=Hibiscus sabdariffa TaxID=183260 RepID=A0ABR2EMN7_9ROSI
MHLLIFSHVGSGGRLLCIGGICKATGGLDFSDGLTPSIISVVVNLEPGMFAYKATAAYGMHAAGHSCMATRRPVVAGLIWPLYVGLSLLAATLPQGSGPHWPTTGPRGTSYSHYWHRLCMPWDGAYLPGPVRCTTNAASRLCLVHPGLVPLPFSWDRPGPCLMRQGPTASTPLWIGTWRSVVPTHPSSTGRTVDRPRPLRTAVSALPAMVLSHGTGPWSLLPAATRPVGLAPDNWPVRPLLAWRASHPWADFFGPLSCAARLYFLAFVSFLS